MSLSVYAERSSPTSSPDEEEEQGKQVPRKIREETEAICYEFCDQEGQEDRRLSAEERARLHESASECIRGRVRDRNDNAKRAAKILRVFASKMEKEFQEGSELGQLARATIEGPDGPDIQKAQHHIQQVVQLLFQTGQISLAKIATAFAYAYHVSREFVQSIRDRHDLVKALTNIASWLLTSFVTVKLSEALQQSGSWGALIANYMPSWPQDNNNVLFVLGLAFLAVWAIKKYLL